MKLSSNTVSQNACYRAGPPSGPPGSRLPRTHPVLQSLFHGLAQALFLYIFVHCRVIARILHPDDSVLIHKGQLRHEHRVVVGPAQKFLYVALLVVADRKCGLKLFPEVRQVQDDMGSMAVAITCTPRPAYSFWILLSTPTVNWQCGHVVRIKATTHVLPVFSLSHRYLSVPVWIPISDALRGTTGSWADNTKLKKAKTGSALFIDHNSRTFFPRFVFSNF
jgi:hypothetical protein